MAKSWKKQEVTYLKRYADRRLLSELAERFETKPEEVENKLVILGLMSKDGHGAVPVQLDPLVPTYERGIKAMQQKKWRDAVKHLERVVDEAEDAELAGRARRFLKMCKGKVAKKPARAAKDPFLQAVYERNRGNLEAALELCVRGGRQSKDERFAYLAASIHSLMEDKEKAAKFLALAIELNPKNRIHAFHDSDFETLRASSDHKQLFEQE